MNTQRIAATSTAAIVALVYWLVYLIATAVGFTTGLSHLGATVVCVLLVLETYKFCKQEADLANGDINAD
jgi:hypothetical protein